MLEAHHVTSAGGKKKTKFSLPAAYEGEVHQGALYHAVRAYLSNQRQGTHSTKTRAEVSGGGKKPWRQKGTGRARQGTIRAAQWRGGGVVFGPKPRSYRVDLPRKVKRLAKQSALNARAQDGALYVIESMTFESPKTRQVVDILTKLGIQDKKVLLLTAEHRPEVFLSSRNLPRVHTVRYVNASAYEILWADALVIEEAAFAIHQQERPSVPNARAKRVKQAREAASKAQARTKKVGTDA
ncbi:MAG: 50S ribosomal protein L4 [Gemmatimonadetes bacterium]|nr:50S ribosomal protein L4 [Gemmatimonadota bacterium]